MSQQSDKEDFSEIKSAEEKSQQEEKPVQDDEPQISDEVEVLAKKTTLKYKIDPLVAYYPECTGASKEALINIRNLYTTYKIKEGNEAVTALKLDSESKDEKVILCLHRINLWRVKAHYQIGDYKTCLEQVESHVDQFFIDYPGLNKEFKSADTYSTLEKIANGATDEKADQGCTVSEIVDEADGI